MTHSHYFIFRNINNQSKLVYSKLYIYITQQPFYQKNFHPISGDSLGFNKFQNIVMKSIAAFGNPLLDTTINITDDILLKKYNLKKDDQKEIGEIEMKSLLNDIKQYEQKYSPGGSAQNTLRVLQWLVGKQYSAIIFGSTGNDNEGVVLKTLLERDGVQTGYIKQSNYSTGASVALVNGPNRSLVACLGAAEVMSLNDLLSSSMDTTEKIQNSYLVYMEGYFLTKRLEPAKFILDFCNKNNKLFAFNISAQYMCEEYTESVKHFAENCDILFGNKREFQALCNHTGRRDINSLVKKLVEGKTRVENYGKIIIITNGAKSVKCIHSNGKVDKMFVPRMKLPEIVDTTGAGDAFVAGYFVGLFQQQSPNNCAKLGCHAAQAIIKRTGCTIPETSPDLQRVFSS